MYMSAMCRCSGSTKGVFMAERLFGTDGLRGTVNNAPMTVDVALRLGLAAGVRFRRGPHQHKVVIGKDTRLSGYMFESALTAGLCAAGMHVIMTGPLPTPAISFLTRSMRADLGVVISASHNPFSDNGIKFFDADGYKLPDQTENEIAEMVLNPDMAWPYPDPRQVGRATKIEDAGGRYIVYTKSCFPTQLTLSGLRIVVDCANGASYKVAPLALEELGAEVFRLSTAPDGTNINDHCGSLYPEVVAAKVREVRADVGLALDGDADRLIVVDEHGNVLDGDQLMALCAQSMMARGELPGNMLVATVMSNLALEIFMREHGGTLLRTKVGDRYVVEAMRREGAMLGGEQSGHLIFRGYSTTGSRPSPRGSSTCGWKSACPLKSGRPSAKPWPRWKRNWPGGAGCCCATRAPRPSAGSWWKARMRTRSGPLPRIWRMWLPVNCVEGGPPTSFWSNSHLR